MFRFANPWVLALCVLIIPLVLLFKILVNRRESSFRFSNKDSEVTKSNLKVRSLTDEQIEKYFLLLGPYDKAGGFSIEGVGSIIFDNIEGSYFNILGLPMTTLTDLLEKLNLDITKYIETKPVD